VLSLSGDIIEFSTLESKCVYLPNERMKMEYKYIKNSSQSFNSDLVKRGWRRFGDYYSRPNCGNCNKCISLRIDVKNFQFSSSQRKILTKNSDTKIIIRRPSISLEHLKLYDKYHRYMKDKKGWDYYKVNGDSYCDLYVNGFSTFGKEILYIRDSKLVGVDLVDFVDDGLSAIYFYYDPSYNKLSLGNYSLFKQIEIAKERELEWIYLGYYVADCDSLNYKVKFKPYQTLQNNPDFTEADIWSVN